MTASLSTAASGCFDPSASFLARKNSRITREILDLLHGNDDHFLRRVDLQDLHIVTDRMADGILDHQLLIVDKHNFYPILHKQPLLLAGC